MEVEHDEQDDADFVEDLSRLRPSNPTDAETPNLVQLSIVAAVEEPLQLSIVPSDDESAMQVKLVTKTPSSDIVKVYIKGLESSMYDDEFTMQVKLIIKAMFSDIVNV